MLGQRQLTAEEYMAIWRRRRKHVLISFLLGPLVGYGLTFVLPAKYTSSTLVLVEQQKVPDNYVKPVINDVFSQRLATMQEQILSRTRLQPVIERFRLYHYDASNSKEPMEELVATMRKNISVLPIRSPVSTRPDAILPGFTIAFTNDDPKTAQQVCSEITSMFIEENLKIREQRAQGTTDFLTKQLEEAKRNLDQQDAKLAQFKRKYVGQIPGQEQPNMNLMMTLNSQLDAVTAVINRTQQDKAFAEPLLAQQVAAWESAQAGSGANPQTMDQQLAALQAQLVTLEGRYTPDHPDVIKLRADIAQLKKSREKEAASKKPEKTDSEKANLNEPPQILQLRTQIRQYKQTLEEKTHEQDRLQRLIREFQAKIQLSPAIEEEYKDLNRDYSTAVNFYDDLLAKKTQSGIATDLERRQQGEQFRVMDPPNLPEQASFPNPIVFTGGGAGSGLVIGFMLLVLFEMKDKSLRSERDIEFFLEVPTLALLPVVDQTARKNGRGFWRFGKKSRQGEVETSTELVA